MQESRGHLDGQQLQDLQGNAAGNVVQPFGWAAQ
jgi:hypothetical protein